MNPQYTLSVDEVKAVLVDTLGLEDREDMLEPSTPLFGSLPELDSLAVAELVLALETRFDIEFDGEDITAEAFETLASLTELVDGKRS